ncbi:MAG: hypothetical protein ABIH42_10340 [Planctomycetota bacterium]
MVKVEVIYSGPGTKINLSDNRTIKLRDGMSICIPLKDWENSYSTSENFKLKEADKEIKLEITKEEKSSKRKSKKYLKGGN